MSEFISQPVVWVFLTLAVYFLSQLLHIRLKWVLTSPILITILILILVLILFNIEFEVYNTGGKYISFFLGPSVVALGVLFYENYEEIKNNIKPFLIAVTLGGLTSVFSVVFILSLLHSPDYLIRSLIPKSVTTPIAIEISKSISGLPSVTAGVVITVGIFGNAFGFYILKFLGIKSKSAIGSALGTASHGIGTARALEESEISGIYSGLALCVNGCFTALLLPYLITWISII